MIQRTFITFSLLVALCAGVWAQGLRQVAVLEIPGRPGFDGIAVVKGMVLMSHAGAGTVDIFDPVKRRLIGHIKGLSDPHDITADADGGRVFIANAGAKSIVVVSTEDWQVKDNIPLPSAVEHMMFVPAWGTLMATDPGTQSVVTIDLQAKAQGKAAPVHGYPAGMTFDSKRGLVYVTIQDQKQVVAIDRGMQEVGKFPLQASQPTSLVYDRKQDRIYVSVRYAVLSLQPDGRELSRTAAPGGIDSLWLDEDASVLYGAAGGSLLVMKTNGRLTAVDEVATDVKGHSVAYDPDHKLVVFPGGREGRSKLLLLKPISGMPQPEVNAEAKLVK